MLASEDYAQLERREFDDAQWRKILPRPYERRALPARVAPAQLPLLTGGACPAARGQTSG